MLFPNPPILSLSHLISILPLIKTLLYQQTLVQQSGFQQFGMGLKFYSTL